MALNCLYDHLADQPAKAASATPGVHGFARQRERRAYAFLGETSQQIVSLGLHVSAPSRVIPL